MGSWGNTYDSLNRLSMATWTPPSGPTEYFCWSYDAFGNRTDQMTTTGAGYANTPGNTCSPASGATTIGNFWAYYTVNGTANTGDNGKNQLTGDPLVPPLQYDAAGNVTFDGTNVYAYDGDGRLCAVQPISGSAAFGYVYDADGNRIAKGTINASATPFTTPPSCDPTSNGFQLFEDYVLDTSGQELSMLDGNSNWQRTNVFGAGKLLATYDPNGLHFHVTDPLGTRRLQTSMVGQPETDIQSLPFGDQLTIYPDPDAPTTADDATPLHFTGKERDTESSNDYFGARYYVSNMGRFLSPDWAASAEAVPYANFASPQTLNLYAYVGNNPISRVDPDGHVPLSWGGFEDCEERHDCNGGGQTDADVKANQAALQAEAQARAQQTQTTVQDKRDELADAAHSNVGNKNWGHDTAPCGWKCSKFVHDMMALVGVGVNSGYKGGEGPVAADLANPKYHMAGWTDATYKGPVAPGSIVAYKANYSDATGDSGIITRVVNGVAYVAHGSRVDVRETPLSDWAANHAADPGGYYSRTYVGP